MQEDAACFSLCPIPGKPRRMAGTLSLSSLVLKKPKTLKKPNKYKSKQTNTAQTPPKRKRKQ